MLLSKTTTALHTKNAHPAWHELVRISSIIVGAVLVAFGLEGFLIPNGFLDGGITGISILASQFINIPIGIFIGVLNIPFLVLAWLKLGRRSAARTAIGVATLALTTVYLHHMDPLTENYVLALGYGGLLLGLGVGVAIRQGGALDGTEALAAIISNKSRLNVDQLILIINIAIFIVAALITDPQKAMSSALLFYVVVAPIIDRIVSGSSEMKQVRVSTGNPKDIAKLIVSKTGRRVTAYEKAVFEPDADCFGDTIHEVSFSISRLEEADITESILELDPDAVVSFVEISSLRGGVFETNTH